DTGADAEPMRFARQLLRRWGVVVRELLARESRMPPWRVVLGALRALEARGEIRGGRFVAGLVGEQFALPEAVEALRAVRRGAALARNARFLVQCTHEAVYGRAGAETVRRPARCRRARAGCRHRAARRALRSPRGPFSPLAPAPPCAAHRGGRSRDHGRTVDV